MPCASMGLTPANLTRKPCDLQESGVSKQIVKVPDLGGADEVEVIEIPVAAGELVAEDDSIVVLESDKASMEVPSPLAGTVVRVLVSEGQKVTEGDDLLEVETEEEQSADTAVESDEQVTESEQPVAAESEPESRETEVSAEATAQNIVVPDLGGTEAVEVIEVMVKAGDEVEKEDTLLVMESDKASMEMPAPFGGVIETFTVKVGDEITSDQIVGSMLTAESGSAAAEPTSADKTSNSTAPKPDSKATQARQKSDTAEKVENINQKHSAITLTQADQIDRPGASVYAGPAVRGLARDLGVNLSEVSGSGPKNRILKEDVQTWVKQRLSDGPVTTGSGIPPVPGVDFAAFGEIALEKMSGIQKATVTNMSRSWLNVPHVTQFDRADITELETFRATLKQEMEERGTKLTPLPFLLKACALALRENPKFNASLHSDGEHLVMKNYFHIGMAVDTPNGLLVPVIRDVLEKSLWDLAAESADLAARARARKLKPVEMQGGCFTVSSLGGIGGDGFTPIVNAPEVGILGVSKLRIDPVWNGSEFLPRKMLPLCLSYDHRVVNGADGGKFLSFLCQLLADIRRFML